MALFGLVPLPPLERRTLIQLWQFADPPAPVLRSIEVVEGRYYMVARVLDERGCVVGGSDGIPLERIAFNEYRQANGVDAYYRISETGELHCYGPGDKEPSIRCTPLNLEQVKLGA